MGVNFPDSPTNGQTTTVGNTTYSYNSSVGAWEIVSSGGIGTMTTKGDLLSRSSSGLARVGVGANGQVLTADSAETSGMKWGSIPGLEFVKSSSFSSSTEIDVLSCFSSAYDSYRIIVSGYKTTAGADVMVRMISGTNTVETSGYYSNILYNASWTTASLGGTGYAGGANTAWWTSSIAASTGSVGFSFELFHPNMATTTSFSSLGSVADPNWMPVRVGGGALFNTTQYTGVRVYGGTITAGTVRVYGYRN